MNNAFRMSVSACERWFSTVRLLMLSSRAISSLFIPDSRLILYIFLTLWNNRSSLHTINNLKPYLFRISKNAVYRHIERTLLFRNYQQKETEKYIPPLESNETDDNIHLKELELLVTMVVEKMPPQRQKIKNKHVDYK